MTAASVVIPFHSSRADNLHQMLRLMDGWFEIVVVCQDRYELPGAKVINLNQAEYNRSMMNNLGVQAASHDVVILLDSDRVLPPGYFKDVVAGLKKNQCVSTWNLWQLHSPVSDVQIRAGVFPAHPDHRSRTNEMHLKNMFSGNTVMFKEDYLRIGMMDESFAGYGYNDTDMTHKAMKCGMEMVWRGERELHLYHTKQHSPDEVRRANVQAGIRYCRKWGLPAGSILIEKGKMCGIDVAKELRTHARLLL